MRQLSSFGTHAWPKPGLHAILSCQLTDLVISANVSSLFKVIITHSYPLKLSLRIKKKKLLCSTFSCISQKCTNPFTTGSSLSPFLALCGSNNKMRQYRFLISQSFSQTLLPIKAEILVIHCYKHVNHLLKWLTPSSG